MNYSAAFKLLGRLIVLLGAVQLFPMMWCLWFGEYQHLAAFGWSCAVTMALGLALATLRSEDPTIYRREGILIVVLGWVLGSAVGALPYLFTGVLPSAVDALFESASGFTTTGATVLENIEGSGFGLLFWRSLTQWLGGLGIVVVFLALLSGAGSSARVLYRFEVPGPTKEVLHTRVQETAFALFKLYLGLTLIQTVLLELAGLTFYEALTHSLSTLSSGGFSPRADSAAGFPALVQIITIVFMLIAAVNFSLLYGIRFRRWRLWRDREFAVYVSILLLSIVIVSLLLITRRGMDFGESLLQSTFQVVSLSTSSGFVTANYDGWPAGAKGVLLALMLIGGCAGSTAGGIKVARVYLAFKTVLREVKLSFKPNAVIPISMRGQIIKENVVSATSAFLLLFFLALIFGTIVLSLGGADLVTAATASLAALSNIGPGLAGIGPENDFAFFDPASKLLLIGLMWLGRLEIFAIASLFTRSFWRR